MAQHFVSNIPTPLMDHEVLDLVCIGFGPASLAVAVALEDWAEATNQAHQSNRRTKPKARYLERQESFKWHPGMLIQSAKMQISFVKDLATARDPLSRFTFLNYLKEHGRLAQFARLNTFLPSRAEFADYMKWVAGHFEDRVSYGHDVLQVRPIKRNTKVSHFEIEVRQRSTGKIMNIHTKQVVIGIGGSPNIPTPFTLSTQPWCIHSSSYVTRISSLLPSPSSPYSIAVIGSGQSAAEIFDDLSRQFPVATTNLIFRDTALRPSDDSPFVNEIFDPDRIDTFFRQPKDERSRGVKRDKATNYSVVRLDLIERIYQDLCMQAIENPKREDQRRRILSSTEIDGAQVHLASTPTPENAPRQHAATLNLRTAGTTNTYTLPVDAVILATGYSRKAHLDMLRPCEHLNPAGAEWAVRRDYSLAMNRNLVEDGVGVWLQGCNEETHGLSDSLLSVLATRSGEVVNSMFGRSDSGRDKIEGGARL